MKNFINITIEGEDGEAVFISNQNTAGIFESNTMIDGRAGHRRAKHKTLNGAKKWAQKTLGI